jgi:hypothetical protein
MSSETEAILHYAKEDSSEVTEVHIPQGDVLIGALPNATSASTIRGCRASMRVVSPEGFWITDMNPPTGR